MAARELLERKKEKDKPDSQKLKNKEGEKSPDDIKAEIEKRLEELKKIAHNDKHPDRALAQYQLSLIYETGQFEDGFKLEAPDLNLSHEYLMRAVNLKFPPAQFELANRHVLGKTRTPRTQDSDLIAFKLYEQAAISTPEPGIKANVWNYIKMAASEAQYIVGMLYRTGDADVLGTTYCVPDLEESLHTATKYFELAKHWDHKLATLQLAECRLELSKRTDNKVTARRNAERAYALYGDLAEKGDAVADCRLGDAFRNGYYHKKSTVHAYEHYSKAGRLGDAIGAFQAGLFCETGVVSKQKKPLIKQDKLLACEWYVMSFQMGLGKEHNRRCDDVCLEGFSRLSVELKMLYENKNKAALSGDPEAIFLVGFMCEEGLGTKVDLLQARDWYVQGASKNHKKCMEGLRELIIEKRQLLHDEPSLSEAPSMPAGAISVESHNVDSKQLADNLESVHSRLTQVIEETGFSSLALNSPKDNKALLHHPAVSSTATVGSSESQPISLGRKSSAINIGGNN